MIRDLRFALRTLARTPGSTAVVIATLAIAIAAGTIVYSTIDMVVHLLPIAKRDGMVCIISIDTRRSEATRMGVSVPDLADILEQSTTIDGFAGFTLDSATLTGVDVPTRVSIVRATGDLPAVWGLRPAAGRLFGPVEARAGAERVVVLMNRFWQTQFASNPSAIGASVRLDSEPYTIIGVLPADASIGALRDRDLVVPLTLERAGAARETRDVLVTARLKEGVARETAAAEIDSIAARLRAAYPVSNEGVRMLVLPLIELSGFNVRFLLLVLSLVAVLVVAMACANVANIVLAWATARAHERLIRAALGASRVQLTREMMTESLVTSLIAGGVGLLFASWGLVALQWFAGAETVGFADLRLNRRVLAAAIATSFVTPFVFAFLPALRSSRASEDGLKDVGRSRMSTVSGGRIRALLVAGQVALAMILLIQIALLVRAAWDLTNRDPGFDTRQALTFRIELPSATYSEPAVRAQFFRSVLEQTAALPSVTSAAAIDRLPVADAETLLPLTIEGAPQRPLKELPVAARAIITSDYRKTLRIPLLGGRDITATDVNTDAAVALVSEEAVRRFWSGASPIGSRIGFTSESGVDRWLTVVGVVGNVRRSDADQGPLPQVYIPLGENPPTTLAFAIRTSTPEPLALVPTIRSEVARLDPNQPVYEVASLEEVVFEDLSSTYVLMLLLGSVAIVTVCLAAAGIYGVVSFAVSQRIREIGVRMALGARPEAVSRMIAAQGTLPAAIGGIVGLLAALALALGITPSIAEVNARDPMNYGVVALCLALVAVGSSYVPARRASRVDPAITLRAE